MGECGADPELGDEDVEEILGEEGGLTMLGKVGGDFLLEGGVLGGDWGGDLDASSLSLDLNMPFKASKKDLVRGMRFGAKPLSPSTSTSWMGFGVLLRRD